MEAIVLGLLDLGNDMLSFLHHSIHSKHIAQHSCMRVGHYTGRGHGATLDAAHHPTTSTVLVSVLQRNRTK